MHVKPRCGSPSPHTDPTHLCAEGALLGTQQGLPGDTPVCLECTCFGVSVYTPVNRELPDVQAGFRKGRGTRNQIASIRWIIEKAKEFQINIYFCFID